MIFNYDIKFLIKTYTFFVIFFIASSFLFSESSFASFSLDQSFGSGGENITSFGNDASISTSFMQSDGKILIGGYGSDGNHRNWKIGRYNSNGTLDQNFAINGILEKDFGYDNVVEALTIQSNGKIVSAGSDISGNGPRLWTVARYNNDGSLDSIFANNGVFLGPLGDDTFEILTSSLLQLDDKIITGGFLRKNGAITEYLTLVRQNSDGSLDQTFGNAGIVTASIGNAPFVRVRSVSLQQDGKIIIFGELSYGGNSSVYVARFNTNGTIDSSFGTNGSTIDYFGTSDGAEKVALQPDGKIVTTGYFNNGGGNMMYLIRYNADGSHDITFGSNGFVLNPFATSDYASSILLQSDGKIIIGGSAANGNINDFALSRFNINGSVDTAFGNNGRLITSVGLGGSNIQSMLFQSNGKILAAGGAFNGSYFDWALAQFADNASPSSDLNVPLLKQTDSAWGGKEYDSALNWDPMHPTIGDYGCAMTSAAMILKYYGINKLPDTTVLNPGTLNTWLKNQKDGYVGDGLLNWLAISRLSKLSKSVNNINSFDALEYKHYHGANTVQLSNDLNAQSPDILEESGHFIVAKGINNSTYDINDPFYPRLTLTDGYANTFLSLGSYKPSFTDLSYIMITVDPTMQIVLKDNSNTIVGEQFTQQPLGDAMNGGLLVGKPLKILYFQKPVNGNYKVLLSGQVNQTYQLNDYFYDKDGNVNVSQQPGIINSTDSETVTISFDSQNASSSGANRLVTFQSTIDDINELQNIGLIKNGNSLLSALSNAQKDASSGNISGAQSKLDLFTNHLNTQRGKGISETAYQILFYDVQYLKTHL